MGINQGPISLDQKYTQGTGHIFLTGIQALVRLPMAQIRRDRAAGLNTAGFISGYRGSPLGGYDQQLFAGDDHGAKSSTVPHQSDHAFISALMPYLYPSSIHEMIEMGLLGIAMSRYSGCWVGMKVITETVETTAEIDLTDEMTPFAIPTDFEMPPGGLNLRWPDDRYAQD